MPRKLSGLIERPCNSERGVQQARDFEWVVQVLGDTQTTFSAQDRGARGGFLSHCGYHTTWY